MGWKMSYTKGLMLLLAILAALLLARAGAFEPPPSDAGAPSLRFTEVSFAQEKTAAETVTDLKDCIITLAYVEFIADGTYHTPKVTITYKGRKLRKNTDYKLAFSGGRDVGKSVVTVTGIGAFHGVAQRTYTGIAGKTTTTSPPKAAKPQKTTKPAATKGKTATTKPAGTAKTTAPAKPAGQAKTPKTAAKPTRAQPVTTAVPPAAAQTIRSIASYTFPEAGRSMSLSAKSSSGLKLKFRSSNPSVVAVDAKGVMKAKQGGTAKITIRQAGNSRFKPVSRTVKVTVPSLGSREEALKPWRHVLIDTYFHINGRKYSHGNPGKYWKTGSGKWSGKTGKKGNTQSCVTLSTVSLKRLGLLSAKSGCVWLSSNHGTKPNKTVCGIRKKSKTLTVSYPHKSLKYLARHDQIRYGDILIRSGHTFVYMGKDSGGHPLIYESGSRRDIGNGTCVIWGHHDGGHADKLTGKINKQIKRSDEVGSKWRKGKLSDASFRGHRASGKNLNKPIHIVCSIRTFKIRTSCINGTISPASICMAGQSRTIRFAPAAGKSVEYVKVDGRKVKAKSKYTFRKITADHSIEVKCKQ